MNHLPDISAPSLTLFWFRRDLRLDDTTGFYQALVSGHNVLPVFIFDTEILDKLEDRDDRRITFIHQQLERLSEELAQAGSSLLVLQGKPLDVFRRLTEKYKIAGVYANEDYEPYAIKRDKEVAGFLNSEGVSLHLFKDQVIIAKNEVVKEDGQPYTVFTPYSKKWKLMLGVKPIQIQDTKGLFSNLCKVTRLDILSVEQLGFVPAHFSFPSSDVEDTRIRKYSELRDIPSVTGTTQLSVHLRFGTVSIRKLVLRAKTLNETFLNELIWREFYMMILWHFPHVDGRAFKPAYDRIRWINDEDQFDAWTKGMTGIPLVDAGMRQLLETGYMHNRVRMVVAGFLTKNLLIDWRWGEAWFARKLNDFELASNNGGWQWSAGTGCDAAPYFRVFNPVTQAEKFDPQSLYIKKWIPEWGTAGYPKPVIDLKSTRERAISTYQKALNLG